MCVWNEEAGEIKRRSEDQGSRGFRWTGKAGFVLLDALRPFHGCPCPHRVEGARWPCRVGTQARHPWTGPGPHCNPSSWGSPGKRPRQSSGMPFSIIPIQSPPCTGPMPPPAHSSSGSSSPTSQDGSLPCSACPCPIISQVFLLCRVPLKAALPQPMHPTPLLFPLGWEQPCCQSEQLSSIFPLPLSVVFRQPQVPVSKQTLRLEGCTSEVPVPSWPKHIDGDLFILVLHHPSALNLSSPVFVALACPLSTVSLLCWLLSLLLPVNSEGTSKQSTSLLASLPVSDIIVPITQVQHLGVISAGTPLLIPMLTDC